MPRSKGSGKAGGELLAFAVDAGGAGHAIGMFVEMPTGREGKG
jgi:hypothetical protein